MAKTYQLVAWTDRGQVRMIPSEINSFIREELDRINRLSDRVRYDTYHEVHDLLQVSSAYEKLGLDLLGLGQTEDAFVQFTQAALCCCASSNNWTDTEWGEVLCKPLRGRFFAMFCQCKDLVRKYPKLRYAWDESELQQTCSFVTYADRCFEIEWDGIYGDFWEANAFTKALNFGKNEAYRRRKV
jgi:hypothetical protein